MNAMKPFLNIFILMCMLLLPFRSLAERFVRTEHGIVDRLIDESHVEEPFASSTAVFRLAGNPHANPPQSFISLRARGSTVRFRDHVQDRASIIRTYIERDQWRQALAEVNDGLAINPDDPEFIRLAALINTVLRDFYMANYYYERYTEIVPDDLVALSNWTGVLLRTFRFEEAEEIIEKVVALRPDYLPARFYQAVISVAQDGTVAQRDEWLSLLFPQKQRVLQWIYEDLENYSNILGPRGLEIFCEMVLGQGSFDNIEELAVAMAEYLAIDQTEVEDRLVALDNIRELGFDGLAVPLEKSVVLYSNGRLDQALDISSRKINSYPRQPDILFHHGYFLIKSGDYRRSISSLRESVEISGRLSPKVYLATALIMTGSREEGWEILFDVARSNPDSLADWLFNDTEYVNAIRSDNRFLSLANLIGIPPESR